MLTKFFNTKVKSFKKNIQSSVSICLLKVNLGYPSGFLENQSSSVHDSTNSQKHILFQNKISRFFGKQLTTSPINTFKQHLEEA